MIECFANVFLHIHTIFLCQKSGVYVVYMVYISVVLSDIRNQYKNMDIGHRTYSSVAIRISCLGRKNITYFFYLNRLSSLDIYYTLCPKIYRWYTIRFNGHTVFVFGHFFFCPYFQLVERVDFNLD